MSTLHDASAQWASRPGDERFTSLHAMSTKLHAIRDQSKETVVASRRIRAIPSPDNKGLMLEGPSGGLAAPTHWAFGQLAGLAEAPAGYLRSLASPIAADCINYGLQFKRQVEDIGLLLTREEGVSARAITGPRYGRIWSSDIVDGLIARFGDGLTGDWRVPGEFGHRVEITEANTTLFAGDRDMFVFLADEDHRVEVPDRRNGQPGTLARGFFVKNSEVGDSTLQVDTFLFDYACSNRIVWGAQAHKSIRIRHTPKAPVRWLDEVAPALALYQQESTLNIQEAIAKAKAARIEAHSPSVEEFLAKRFGKTAPAVLQDISMDEEGRPIETLWDAVCAVTARAKGLAHQDARVEMERQAGLLLDLAA